MDNKNGEKIYDKNGNIIKYIGVSFIQFILIDNQMINNNSSIKNINKNSIIKQFKNYYEKYNEYISINYLAHITDYNENNIISKSIFRKGFIHTYNFSFNYMNENSENLKYLKDLKDLKDLKESKKSNMLDYGFMMLHP